ncbi:GMC oxidoreductase [Sphingomonas desiccabilis]|uniref:GMC family oxidoreductase n=1 Tax=Sphingomonas desiccabilis TaxID=429134 RepID=A0A4Q2ISF0_9SPHN|nr:GMC oxidoreductase [Sphingomonas desiccabilis]MBB3911819.1 choline dehydrogenase-like flavoprotein [Sphingomonas desiccabilis]RXZ31465.1 GMC family oxidoreductase [Sphingomonas desiccabilis]
MILDLRHDVLPAAMGVPIVIVGGGPAGITLALQLEKRGVPSLLLEAGSTRIDAAGQDFYRAASIRPEDHGPVHRYRHRVLGGTSAVWGGRCIPFDPIDFEERPWLSDARWPIRYEELAGYYPEAVAMCRAGSPHFTADLAVTDAAGAGMFDMCDPDLVADRIERFSEPTHFGRFYQERLRQSRAAVVLLNAPVLRVVAHPSGRAVKGVVIAAPDGRRIEVGARAVVVASGALETARLLLSSTDQKSCGLGNERDLVGRFYQSHLEGHVGELRVPPGASSRMDYFRDGDGIYCRRYLWLSPEAQRRERLAGLVLRPTHPKVADPAHGNPVLSAMFLVKGMLLPEYARGMNSTDSAEARRVGKGVPLHLRHLGNVLRGSPGLARFATDWTRRRVLARRKLPSVFLADRDGRYPIDVNAEQEPDRDSRVLLGEARDSLGQQRLVIDWRTSEADLARVARGLAVADRALRRAGAARILLPDPEEAVARLTRVGGHHVGTARMAESPASGVVDGHGEAFDVAGLHVLGAAAFPTSGFANPTLTIVALAVRMADRLAGRMANFRMGRAVNRAA